MKPDVQYFIREYIITVRDNQQLNLIFYASTGSFGFINAIEIVSIPDSLYTRGNDNPLTFVGASSLFYLDDNTAFETFYRLNVGGNDITGSGDSGMYRTWHQDTYFIFGRFTGILLVYFSTPKIQYTSATPGYTAPESVYATARSMGENFSSEHNLTWFFSVDAGFSYLVRLHFCDTRTDVSKEMFLIFEIFINNQIAEYDADVIDWSGGNSIPVYRDYLVWIPEGNRSMQDLWLTLRPNFEMKPLFADAILNGLEIFKLNNSEGSLTDSNPELLVVPPPLAVPVPLLHARKKNLYELTIVAGSVFVILCVIARNKKRKKGGSANSKHSSFQVRLDSRSSTSSAISSSLPTHRCQIFTIDEIKTATRNFKDKNIIGSGEFANVYKGMIEDGCIPVAIKRLRRASKQGTHEFITEIEMLSQLRHVNLVSLIGFCFDEGEMILVHDYMINGTLRQHLYGINNNPLPWKKRLEICIGAARGLHYLHSETEQTIIHRDVKTTNILLDEKWIAKVSDFGLSKVALNQEVSTEVKGTWGYLDPEYARYQKLTAKSDVYSFGVVLFEVLCARKPFNHQLRQEQMNLVVWAQKCIQNGTVYELIDPFLRIAPECLNKYVEIALSCVNDKGIERPTMRKVMRELEFALKLQEAADSEIKETKAEDESVYPEVTFVAKKCKDIVSQPESNSSMAIGLTSFTASISKLVWKSWSKVFG